MTRCRSRWWERLFTHLPISHVVGEHQRSQRDGEQTAAEDVGVDAIEQHRRPGISDDRSAINATPYVRDVESARVRRVVSCATLRCTHCGDAVEAEIVSTAPRLLDHPSAKIVAAGPPDTR